MKEKSWKAKGHTWDMEESCSSKEWDDEEQILSTLLCRFYHLRQRQHRQTSEEIEKCISSRFGSKHSAIAKENHTFEFWGQEINPKSYQCLCWLSAQMHTPYLLCDFINRLIQILASKRWKGTKKNWISSMLSKNYLVKDSLYKFIWQIQPRFR